MWKSNRRLANEHTPTPPRQKMSQWQIQACSVVGTSLTSQRRKSGYHQKQSTSISKTHTRLNQSYRRGFKLILCLLMYVVISLLDNPRCHRHRLHQSGARTRAHSAIRHSLRNFRQPMFTFATAITRGDLCQKMSLSIKRVRLLISRVACPPTLKRWPTGTTMHPRAMTLSRDLKDDARSGTLLLRLLRTPPYNPCFWN